jgi:hypothetical protein
MGFFGSDANGYVLETTNYALPSLAVSQNAAYLAYVAYPAPGSPAAAYVLSCSLATPASCIHSKDDTLYDPTQIAGSPSMAVDGSGNPVLAWDEWDFKTRTRATFTVESWNGIGWTPMSGLPLATTPSDSSGVPQLAFDDGQLVVVWREKTSDSGPAEVLMKRYNQ